MEFKHALRQLFWDENCKEIIKDPFRLHCTISDMCGASYTSKEKIKLFFEIDKRLFIFKSYYDGNREIDKYLQSKYDKVKDLVEKSRFDRLVSLILDITTNKITLVKPQNAPQNQANNTINKTQGIVKKATAPPEPPKNVKPKPKNQFKSSGSGSFFYIGIGAFIIAITVFLLTCACVCPGWSIHLRQWIIGIIGGCYITIISAAIIYYLDDSVILEAEISSNLFLTLCVILNFILLAVLKDSYKIVFGCYSVLMLLASTCVISICDERTKDRWTNFQTVELVCSVALIVLGYIIF